MKALKVILAIPLMFVLTLLSMPFIVIAIGHATIGDEQGADRWFERAPLTMWFTFVQERK